MAAVQTNEMRVRTGVVRSSYANVHESRVNPLSGKDEFSMVLLVPKTDKATMAAIKTACEAALQAKFGAKRPTKLAMPVHDGDGEKPNGGAYGPEAAGHWVLNAKSKYKPGIVTSNLSPIMDRNEFQSGDYCRVILDFYGYDNMTKGVGVSLGNIQVVRKGQPLGGGSRAEDDFDEFKDATTTEETDW